LTLQTGFAARWCFWFSANDSSIEQVCPTLVYAMCKVALLPTKRIFYNQSPLYMCANAQYHQIICAVKYHSRALATLHCPQPEKDKQNVEIAPPWKNFCARPCWLVNATSPLPPRTANE